MIHKLVVGEKNCKQCGLSKYRNRIAWGEGPTDALIMVVGEAPGVNENKRGRCWIGMAGAETRHLFRCNGIDPVYDVYWTNLVKCWPKGNADPAQTEIDTCTSLHLYAEIVEIQPAVIVALGRYSASFFLGRTVSIDTVNGIPFETDDFGTVLPIIHPAAGLRRPEDMVKVQYGFSSLSALLNGSITPIRYHDIRDLTGRYWIVGPNGDPPVLDGVPSTIAIDTEWAQGKMFCATVTSKPGQASMLMADNAHSIQFLNSYINNTANCKEVVIQNSLYDVPILHNAGITIPPGKLRDTMVAAYLLQSEPQGLKDLAFRLLQVKMNDYTDVVRPYRFDKAMQYLHSVLEYEWPDPEEVLEFRKGVPHIRKPQNIERIVRKIINDVESGKDVDPFLRWEKIRKDRDRSDISLIEYNLGRLYDGDLSDAPIETAVEYACSDSNATLQIWPILRDRIVAEGMWDAFMVDMHVIPMVADMMRFGIRVDRERLLEVGDKLSSRMEEIHTTITSLSGYDFNPDSPTQVADILYGKLGLDEFIDKRMAKKKSDTMTDDSVLSRLEQHHPVVKWVREYRGYSKLRSSYIDALPAKIDPDGRVRATFRVTRVATGRLSCSDPNLMAMPVRSEEGRMIRDAFIASDGCEIGCADYSQVEMRLTADQSQDKRMCEIFMRGEDIHNKTASAMFGIPESRLDEMKHRYPAKRVGFGVLNDISAVGLQRELIVGGAEEGDWPIDRCEELIDTWFDIYSGVREYMDKNRAYAAEHGKIVDMWGRVRWVPWATAKTEWKKEEGLKQAGNTPIQSGAQGIIKRAMVKLQPLYIEYREKMKVPYYVVPLIQIHDDIVSDIDKRVINEFQKKQKMIMETAVKDKMRIPLVVDLKRGERWGSTKKVKF